MNNPITPDELADEVAAVLDSMMIREETEDVAWLGAYSNISEVVTVEVDGRTFHLSIEDVTK